MSKLLNLIENCFTVLSLMIFSGAIIVLVLSGGQQEYEEVSFDASLIRMIFFAIYLVTFVLLVLRWRKTLNILGQNWWIFPLVILSAISIVWSFEKSGTLKDSFTMIGSSLFGFYFAVNYSLKRQLELLGWAFGIIIVLSFVFAVALPKYGIMGGIHQGKWRGVFSHKNGLGQIMVYSSLVFIFLAYQSRKYQVLMLLGLSSSIVLLFLSASTSSMLNLVILISIFFCLRILRLPYLLLIPAVALIATVGEFLYFLSIENTGAIFTSVGKDATLTGRTDLWPLVIEMIWKQPILGYGFGGFWHGLNGAGSAYIWRATGWLPSHPHNGYLQLLLDLGILGVILFSLGFFTTLFKALKLVRSTRTADALWPIVHMSQLLITSTTESQLFVSNNMNWLLYVTVAFSLQANYGVVGVESETRQERDRLPTPSPHPLATPARDGSLFGRITRSRQRDKTARQDDRVVTTGKNPDLNHRQKSKQKV